MFILAQTPAWLMGLLDHALAWLLVLPRDVALVVLGVGTSLLLVAARRWTTNQGQLRRSRGDLRRLKTLIREAKRAKDKPTIARLRRTLAMVRGLRLGAELKPLIAAIGPVILLALWAAERLDYFPPKVGEDLEVRAYYPLSAVGRLTHMVPPAPPAGDWMRSRAVQEIEVDPDGEENGIASWELCPTAESSGVELTIRYRGETATHQLRVGGNTYAPPVNARDGGAILATEVVLRRAKFLGLVPGLPAVGCPPWVVAYLLMVIPLAPFLRRLLRVC